MLALCIWFFALSFFLRYNQGKGVLYRVSELFALWISKIFYGFGIVIKRQKLYCLSFNVRYGGDVSAYAYKLSIMWTVEYCTSLSFSFVCIL